MKYCQHCGEQLSDDATFCGKCGQICDGEYAQTNFGPNQYNQTNQYQQNPEAVKSLRGTIVGVIMGVFLGLIGLILCLIMGDAKCKKACIISFAISFVLSIIATIIFNNALIDAFSGGFVLL